MRGKIFTPEEANRMLPLVSRIADDIVATYLKVHSVLREFEAEKAQLAATDPTFEISSLTPNSRLGRLDADVARLLDRFQTLIEEIEALGGTVKDYERGCIDFYGEVDGRIVYLCWQRGEACIDHWHALEEGYANCQPIPLPSAA